MENEIEYHYKLIQSSAGNAGSGVYLFNLPSNQTFSNTVSKGSVFTQINPLSGAQYYSYSMVKNMIKADGYITIGNGASGTVQGQIMVYPVNATQFHLVVFWSNSYAYFVNSTHVNMGSQYVSLNFKFSAQSDVSVNKSLNE